MRPDGPRPAARDFGRYWSGQAISVLGDQVGAFVLPTLAITTFGASALEVGVLNGLTTGAYAVLGLLVGALMDRRRRRPALVGADLVRAAAFGTVPLASVAGLLTLGQLFVVAALAGCCAVVFNVASQSHLPVIVSPDRLPVANARLEMSAAVALVAGPAVGGLLVQWWGAAPAVAVNAASFLFSVAGLLALRTPEPAPPPARPTRLRAEIRAGLSAVRDHPVLLRTTVASGLRNAGNAAVTTVVLVFVYRGVGLSAGTAGLLFAVGTAAALAGAGVTGRLLAGIGVGRTLLLANAAALVWVLAPLALVLPAVPVLLVLRAVSSLSLPLWNATVATVRQSSVSADLLGRINATVGTVNWTAMPLGSLAAGAAAGPAAQHLGEQLGLSLVLAASGGVAGAGSALLRHRCVREFRLPTDVGPSITPAPSPSRGDRP